MHVKGWLISVCAVVFILMASSAIADVPHLINYQGRLTDSTGAPVDDDFYQMTFTIYDGAGAPLWTSAQVTVEVKDGLFNYLLGSSTDSIPDSVFQYSILYLGIQVGTDAEITPRTQLVSSAFAAVAGRVNSDNMESGEGYLYLKNINGDSIFTFTTDVDGGSLMLTTPLFGGKGKIPIIGLNSHSAGGAISIYATQPLDKKIMEFVSDSDIGGRISMYLTQPLDRKLLEFGELNSGEGCFNMYAPDPHDDRVMFSLKSSPTDIISMYFFQPQPEPPGMVAIEMGMNTAEKGNGGGKLSIFDADSLEAAITGGDFRIYHRNNSDLPNGGMQVDSEMVSLSLKGEVELTSGHQDVIVALIDSLGARLGIGTDSTPEALTVMGNGWFSGDVFTFTDTKAKKNIQPINNALQLVSRMNGYYYDCRTDEFPNLRMPENRQVGFLAHEVKEVLPEIVGENKYGLTGVDYSRITALLVEAVKEQQETINQLEQRIEELEQQ